MNFLAAVFSALHSLCRNPMRALLTTLGIVIGVASVIVIMEIGNGASGSLETTLSDLGVRNLLIRPGASFRDGIRQGVGTAVTLNMDDCYAIERECPAIRAAVPMFWGRNIQAIYGNNNCAPGETNGSTPEYLQVRNWELRDGSMFSDRDVATAAPVCVIGQTVENELFGSPIGVGREIRVGTVMLRVVGVLAYKGANLVGQDQDDLIVMPWTTLRYRVTGYPRNRPNNAGGAYPETAPLQMGDTMYSIRFATIDSIMATVWNYKDLDKGKSQITQLLRERHRLRPNVQEDFYLRDFSEIGEMIKKSLRLMTTLLMVVAMISLVVGGVGIMNIMLVSVTERTREIGLRMAVGARGQDILTQFLIESIVLCLGGGIMGIMLGRVIALLLQFFLGWTAAMSLPAVVAGLGVSMGVGLIFGFYPALKASRLDPIDALRYE